MTRMPQVHVLSRRSRRRGGVRAGRAVPVRQALRQPGQVRAEEWGGDLWTEEWRGMAWVVRGGVAWAVG